MIIWVLKCSKGDSHDGVPNTRIKRCILDRGNADAPGLCFEERKLSVLPRAHGKRIMC